jgi:hypothetical protein
MTEFAPIAIFVYNRPEHARRTLEKLLECKQASTSQIYIFSDGAKPGDEAKVDQVRAYIKSVAKNKNIIIDERPKNLGLAKSILAGVSRVFESHEKIIVLEDDMLVGKHFLEYENEALEKYKSTSEILIVSGYAYAIGNKRSKAYLLPTSSNQAWGTWKTKWQEINFSNADTSGLNKWWTRFKFNEFGAIDYTTRLLENQQTQSSNSWAILLKWHMFTHSKLTLFPPFNLVENIGWDGTGTNCVESNPYEEKLDKINSKIEKFPTKIKYRKIDYIWLIAFHYYKRTKAFLLRIRTRS